MLTPSQPDPRSTHVAGRLRVVLQAGCLALVAGLVAAFAASVPLRWRHLLTLTSPAETTTILGLSPVMEAKYTSRLGSAEAQALQSFGLSLRFYATYLLTFEVGLALICVAVGLFIFWRRSEGWLTLWVALTLVLLGTIGVSPALPTLATVWPGWGTIYIGAGMLGMVSNLYLLFLTPDGRFVPRWTLGLAAGFTGGMLVMAGHALISARNWGVWASAISLLLSVPFWLVLLGVGIFSQVYRYRRSSGLVERQQTKWVAVGLAVVTLGFLVNASLIFAASQTTGPARVWINLGRAPLVTLILSAFPICLAFSILRYRLWDIDLLIRRTLIYSSLTAALLVVYFGSVVVLQALVGTLSGESRSPLVTVLSTLAIAALFVPLRRRMQDFIDRRFYRRKYDAAQTLAGFAAGARDETDLETLSTRLIDVVAKTMQPDQVSLWLRKVNDHPRPTPEAHWNGK